VNIKNVIMSNATHRTAQHTNETKIPLCISVLLGAEQIRTFEGEFTVVPEFSLERR
jgi:hypothetical protein